MSEFGLTQEEIDALLNGTAEASAAGAGAISSADIEALTALERDALGNLAGVVNAMTGFEYQLESVDIAHVTPAELPDLLGEDLVFEIPCTVGAETRHLMILEPAFAKQVAAALTGGDPGGESNALSELEVSAISEVISTVNGSFLTNLASKLKLPTNSSIVNTVDSARAAEALGGSGLLTSLRLSHDGESATVVRHLIPQDLTQTILGVLAPPPAAPKAAPAPTAAAAPAAAPQAAAAPGPAPGMAAAPQAVPSGNLAAPGAAFAPAAFSQFGPAPMPDIEMRNLDLLLDVPLTITVELGKTTVPIRQILEYGQGSLIALDKLAGEPVDLLVNGKYFARGEVVVIDENFGVRLTSILSPAERIGQLT